MKFLIVLVTLSPTLLQSQWFDQQSINSTVLLEKWQDTSFVPLGTGFVLYNYSSSRQIVVTCEHLLRRQEIFVTINADSMLLKYAREHHADTIVFMKLSWVVDKQKLRAKVSLRERPSPTFLSRPDLDVGVFLIDLPSRTIEGTDTLKVSKLQSIPRSQIRVRKDVGLGDELYFVGFPFGIGIESTLEPLVRSGSVAWLSQSSTEFLLDALSFGGNSGSPVFSKVIIGRKPGEMEWDSPSLVGMILGHIGDKVEGMLSQPDPKSAILKRESRELQNYGLARVVWVDSILPLIERANDLDLGD